LFNIHNLTIRDWSGVVQSDVNAEMQCSGDSPCTGITIEGIDLVDSVNSTRPSQYLCSNVEIPIGFNCTGAPYGENPR
jgi:galacturan 1,4-alpha-galacturonidase